jgi:hypothetical protein
MPLSRSVALEGRLVALTLCCLYRVGFIPQSGILDLASVRRVTHFCKHTLLFCVNLFSEIHVALNIISRSNELCSNFFLYNGEIHCLYRRSDALHILHE